MSDPQFAAFRAAVADRFESRLKLAEEAEPPARRDSLPADVGVTIDRLLRRPRRAIPGCEGTSLKHVKLSA